MYAYSDHLFPNEVWKEKIRVVEIFGKKLSFLCECTILSHALVLSLLPELGYTSTEGKRRSLWSYSPSNSLSRQSIDPIVTYSDDVLKTWSFYCCQCSFTGGRPIGNTSNHTYIYIHINLAVVCIMFHTKWRGQGLN